LGQIAGEALFDLGPDYYSGIVKEYEHRRDTLVKMLNQIPGVVCPNPGGAFYAVASLPVDDADIFCQWMLEKFRYQNATVMMAPASGFYVNAASGKNQVRIAYVLNVEDLQKAVVCLAKGIEQYNSERP
jgi:aspartate aminotransferase